MLVRVCGVRADADVVLNGHRMVMALSVLFDVIVLHSKAGKFRWEKSQQRTLFLLGGDGCRLRKPFIFLAGLDPPTLGKLILQPCSHPPQSCPARISMDDAVEIFGLPNPCVVFP